MAFSSASRCLVTSHRNSLNFLDTFGPSSGPYRSAFSFLLFPKVRAHAEAELHQAA